ncbi:MAG: hypothetical protein JOY54_09070 [Acidobacteriaceae bacterium]|nr:hypothetical protein [Acidobacteriaceae bacterium]
MEDALPKCILPPSSESSWAPPLDVRDLVVRMEADGLTGNVCRSRYGFRNIWEMAEEYLPVAQEQKAIAPTTVTQPGTVRGYLKGVAFALPLLCCCLAVLFFKVSLWGGSMSANQAAAIAMATVASFAVTGGFLQIIGRQAHFYKENRDWGLCSSVCWLFMKAGCFALLACVAAGFAANLYFGWLPFTILSWCAAFHVGIGAYLLISGILYVLDGELLVALATALGTALVIVLHLVLRAPLLPSQITGIFAATGICIASTAFRFRKLRRGSACLSQLPSPGRLVYMLWPYFIYGLLYYAYLFADRMIAWSAATETSSLPFQFRGDYETSLDMCLFAFIVQVGWVHIGLVRFYRIVTQKEMHFQITARRKMVDAIKSFYNQQIAVFGILFVISSVGVVFTVKQIHALEAMMLFRVVLLGLIGIPLLAVGLWNIALLFALSRPTYVLTSVAWALLSDICAGYVLSRLFSYDLAIVGFDIGSAALVCISGWFCRRLFNNFDYHYFAASV